MIEINNLAFAYRKKKRLFDRLSLSLPDGSIYGLLGKNGAGKTTLLRIMTGLLYPQEGQSITDGEQAPHRSPALLRELYFIPEEFYVPPVSGVRFIELYAPFYPRFDHSAIERYFFEFELEKNESLTTLSYGQKKKFLIAFGLACQCKTLLLDEPTNGLDIPSKSQFRRLVASAMTDDRTFIISTHQVRDMENLIDPVIIIDEGRIIFYRDSYEISNRLAVSNLQREPVDGSYLYAEKLPGGFAVVTENTDNRESQIDLELLFNTVIANKMTINDLFKEKEENNDAC